jgi:hypothetical protein
MLSREVLSLIPDCFICSPLHFSESGSLDSVMLDMHLIDSVQVNKDGNRSKVGRLLQDDRNVNLVWHNRESRRGVLAIHILDSCRIARHLCSILCEHAKAHSLCQSMWLGYEFRLCYDERLSMHAWPSSSTQLGEGLKLQHSWKTT